MIEKDVQLHSYLVWFELVHEHVHEPMKIVRVHSLVHTQKFTQWTKLLFMNRKNNPMNKVWSEWTKIIVFFCVHEQKMLFMNVFMNINIQSMNKILFMNHFVHEHFHEQHSSNVHEHSIFVHELSLLFMNTKNDLNEQKSCSWTRNFVHSFKKPCSWTKFMNMFMNKIFVHELFHEHSDFPDEYYCSWTFCCSMKIFEISWMNNEQWTKKMFMNMFMNKIHIIFIDHTNFQWTVQWTKWVFCSWTFFFLFMNKIIKNHHFVQWTELSSCSITRSWTTEWTIQYFLSR